MFSFGAQSEVTNRKGRKIQVGDYAIHVQAPWRLCTPERVIVASDDLRYPADEEADWDNFDPGDSPSLFHARSGLWLEEQGHLRVERVEADSLGGFRLHLEKCFEVHVFPATSLQGEYSEHWRVFRPRDDSEHFVCSNELLEAIRTHGPNDSSDT